ncbi:hypothetical protein [Corynebacterium pacaense]|uniref:hypothetical protein n=1 Tax=Corynebacterium pacaense TaxID=1816684 RepID=UPI001177E19B|nr:hypothetical protein [Corynebacterium pacaense]
MHQHGIRTGVATLTAVALSLSSCASPARPGDSNSATSGGAWQPAFAQESELVTNEWAYRNSASTLAVRSQDWLATSGSLFSRDGGGWSGNPDGDSPDPSSSNATGSSVLRTVSQREDFSDFKVSTQIRINEFSTTPRTPAMDYDGVHFFTNYQDHDNFDSLSLCRRDGAVVIKSKDPANGSDPYVTLDQTDLPCSIGTWYTVEIDVRRDGNNQIITYYRDGVEVLSHTIEKSSLQPGRIGWRSDNVDFQFRDFAVETND